MNTKFRFHVESVQAVGAIHELPLQLALNGLNDKMQRRKTQLLNVQHPLCVAPAHRANPNHN
jgi:hypothetical protein